MVSREFHQYLAAVEAAVEHQSVDERQREITANIHTGERNAEIIHERIIKLLGRLRTPPPSAVDKPDPSLGNLSSVSASLADRTARILEALDEVDRLI